MPEKAYPEINKLLSSTKLDELRKGLDLVRDEISKCAFPYPNVLFDMVSSVFLIDPLDRPDLVPLQDEAISFLAEFGNWAIPLLVESMDTGDIKARWAVSHVLGRIGASAIRPLLNEYSSVTDASHRAFILHAFGKIKSPQIVQVLPLILEAVRSTDLELRDAGTRVIGRLAEAIPSSQLRQDVLQGFVEGLYANLVDPNSGIRAKAIRSLGKLAKYGHLTNPERAILMEKCISVCGQDNNFQWDRAYIVRKAAEEALQYVFV